MAQRKSVFKKSSTSNNRNEFSSSSNAVSSYYISFCETAKEEMIIYVKKMLEEQGVQCKLTSKANAKYLIISAGLDVLTKQAEKDGWMMNVCNSEEMMAFRVEKKDRFELSSRGTVFESAVEVQLLHRVIEDTAYDIDVFRKLSYEVEGCRGFLSALLNSKPPLLGEHFPLHNYKQVGDLDRMLKWAMMPLKGVDVNAVRNYFGESTAFYFAWMNFYSTCILVPAVMGVVMYFLRGRQTTVDTDPYLPFYSVFTAVWALLFLIFWKRRGAVHSFNWNTHSYCSHDELYHKFHGVIVTDPVTGDDMLYYPFWKKRLWYLFSFLAMVPLLSGGVAVMTLSLNLNGYVQDKGSPIYIERLAQFAQPGQIFAADSPYYLWLVPTLMHTIVINIVNMIYSEVARKCTDLENHRTVRQWHSALVVKRVFFECFDCFMPLFYIAFIQLDVVTLRAEIVSLFLSDEIRRVTMEAVIPLVTGMCMKIRVRSQLHEGDGHAQSFLSVYDQFDDYLEMVIQFGYITLFASAFPLGGIVTMLFIYVELRSDVFKLLHAYRRPLPLKCSNIGVWYEVMRVMVFTAILTNCAILGFSSEQLMQWLPFLFTEEVDTGGSHGMAMGSGRYVVGIVFGFEHVLLILAFLMQYAIHPVPKWVRIALTRREHLMKKKDMLVAAASAHEHAPHQLQPPVKKKKMN